MIEPILLLAAAFVVAATILTTFEIAFPSVCGQKILRRGFVTDMAYWFLTPPVVFFLTKMLTPGLLFYSLKSDGIEISAAISTETSLMAGYPIWLQVGIGVFLGDFINYWTHRLLHHRVLWPFHAVHHGSKEVDWLSAVRVHPVNNLLARLIQTIFMLLMGFSETVILISVPLLFFYSLLQHANVGWDFGPLRHILVSPVYHRWHHTNEDEALNKNFANVFVFWDYLFGTLSLPAGRQASRFGTKESVPESFAAQMIYPFQYRRGAQ